MRHLLFLICFLLASCCPSLLHQTRWTQQSTASLQGRRDDKRSKLGFTSFQESNTRWSTGYTGWTRSCALSCCATCVHSASYHSAPLFNPDMLRKKTQTQQPAADDPSQRVCRPCTRGHRLAGRKWVFSLLSLWEECPVAPVRRELDTHEFQWDAARVGQTFRVSLVFLVCWHWHCTQSRRLGHLWSCDQMKVFCLTVSADVTSCFSRNQTNALLTFRGGAFSAALCLYLSLEKDFLVSQLSKSTSGLGCKERSGGHACPSGGSTGQAVVSWHPSTPHRRGAPGGRGLPPAPKETRRAADPDGLWNQAMRMGRSCSRWQECWWGWCTWKALPLTFALTLWKDAAWSLHQPLVSAVPPSLWWAAAVFLQWSPPAEGRGGTANPLGCTWMSSKRRRLRFSRLNVFFLNAMSALALGSYMDTFASACTPVSCLSRAWTREGFAFEWFPFSSQASAAAKLCLWPGSQMLQPWNLPLNIIYTFFSFCRFLHEFNSPHSHYNLVSVHDWIGPRLMPIYSSSG